ncbi:MAG: TlpA disulfide reductase family protein [Pyrinomonadaceae bacterium]
MSNSMVFLARTALCAVLVLLAANGAAAQAPATTAKGDQKAPIKITQIDVEGLRTLIKPHGKPLLINFWATWCDPCREEFPDLVKLDHAYKGKIDFFTVSLDDLDDMNTLVPKFLGDQKAEMPAYLLRTTDESAAIAMVAKDWSGSLPLTVLYKPNGELAYSRAGKITVKTMSAELDKLIAAPPSTAKTDIYVTMDFVKIKDGRRSETLFYYENNWKIYREAALKRGIIHSYELVEVKSETNDAFDLILVTRYAGETKFKDSEKNFEPLLKEFRPSGPVLKNEIKPADFRQNVFMYEGTAVFSSSI